MSNSWRKNEEMAVWTYDQEMAEFREIKKAKNDPLAGFKRMTRVIVWGSLMVFYFFIFFLLYKPYFNLESSKLKCLPK